MYQLRDYQQASVDAAVKFFKSPGKTNGLIVLPTGAGKSLVIANIAYRLDAPVIIFQPNKEILEQNYAKLCSYDVWDTGIFSASFGRKEVRKITFATIGSAINNMTAFRQFKYIIVDECHYVNAERGMYKEFFDVLNCRVLGLTATPYRLHSSSLGAMLKFLTRTRKRVFHELLYHVQVSTLQQRGYLATMNYYQLNIVDPARLKLNSTGADFTDESLREYYKEIKYNDTLENIIRRLVVAGRKSILVFTRFVDEAEHLVHTLDVPAAVVSGETPKNERERILTGFKEKRITVVANVGILTTGFDYPELATVVLARPTMSLSLYYQMCGRAIRPYKDKVSWIVDLCGNFKRFGRVDHLELRPERPESKLWAVYSGQKQLTNVLFNN